MSVAIGYLASVFLAVSLLVKDDLKFRWLNMSGCLSFIIYGVMIEAMPIILTNTILFLINIFYLIRIYRTKEAFEIAEFEPRERIIQKFLQFHKADIKHYFPEFKLEENKNDLRFVVLRDLVIANIFIVSISPEGNARVKINYTVPRFRDYKIGSYIFEKEKKYLLSRGIQRIVYEQVHNKKHASFLERMGFSRHSEDGRTRMTRQL